MISVLIVTRYASEVLDLLIESLLRYQKYDNELIVAADNPSWQVIKLLQDRGFILGPGQKLTYHIVNHRHLDWSWNYTADYATYEWLAFCPDDTVVGPNWDEAIMQRMNNSKRRIVHLRMFQRCVPVSHHTYIDFGVPEWKYSPEHQRALVSPHRWDWAKLEQKCPNAPDDAGGVFWAMHKELFDLGGRYSFHAGHPLGQELAFFERVQKNFGVDRVHTFSSCCFHWGSHGNSDNQKSSLGISNGYFQCHICKKLEPGVKSELYNKDLRSIINEKSGFYLCERCQRDGYKIEECKVVRYT